ncbi:DUF1642 domain-containing protein [Lactococcus lactis]|uniref:DUF1642 domain-containing protein n=1 Tax=Lactococcus lactis TaxID=1358 RepID=UPI001D07226C|nr:DUF1642 domain-containing protein [Lactococcus lactis]MCB6853068.1 DUF1642 domain-containing protein [Lactococcus lactis]MDU6582058.1 DUF1642 domain-containing protein [Lactococcus lactis]
MTKEMKRPTSHISGNSIKPALSKAVEFYTDNNRQAYDCIHERDEYIDYLESQLSNAKPQQSLPVVPECVGEFVSGDETELSKADRIAYLLKSVEGDNYYLEEYLTNAGIISQEQGEHLYAWATNQTHETILELWNGYTVEKPQLFYLREKNTGYYLRKTGNNEYEITPHYSNDYDKKHMHYKFTQSEIDSMETGSYEHVPVEDGE